MEELDAAVTIAELLACRLERELKGGVDGGLLGEESEQEKHGKSGAQIGEGGGVQAQVRTAAGPAATGVVRFFEHEEDANGLTEIGAVLATERAVAQEGGMALLPGVEEAVLSLPELTGGGGTGQMAVRGTRLEALEDYFAVSFAGLDNAVCPLEICGVDGAEGRGVGGAKGASVDQASDFGEEMVLGDHVRGLEDGTGEHELPVETGGFAFERLGVEGGRIVDDADLALRG